MSNVPFNESIWFSKNISTLVGNVIFLNVKIFNFLKLDSTAADEATSSPNPKMEEV